MAKGAALALPVTSSDMTRQIPASKHGADQSRSKLASVMLSLPARMWASKLLWSHGTPQCKQLVLPLRARRSDMSGDECIYVHVIE